MNTPFEKRICMTICICQLTAVLSCVSIVYLTVAVYMPSTRILNSGFSETPVICTTISNNTYANCEVNPGEGPSWGSCGEWCLSKSSGYCTQIRVDVRNNGTNIRLEKCLGSDTKYCSGIDPNKAFKNCISNECRELHGLFNCTLAIVQAGISDENYGARCRDLTSVMTCMTTSHDPPITCNSKKACLNLNGLYDCNYGKCSRIRVPFKCEKRCIGIKTGEKDVIVRAGDIIFTGQCERAVEIETGIEIWPKNQKSLTDPELPPTLLMFCTNIVNEAEALAGADVILSDCLNGTFLEPGLLGNSTNITHLLATHHENTRYLDPGSGFAPPEIDLLIYNNTPLYINYEACVNTLILAECERFHAEYGGDGTDLRAQSRFLCYHSPNSSDFVVLRFNRIRTLFELAIASGIPITLAIVSCFTLIVCSRIIHISDDSHLYFQCCGNNETKAALEKEAVEAMAL